MTSKFDAIEVGYTSRFVPTFSAQIISAINLDGVLRVVHLNTPVLTPSVQIPRRYHHE